MELPDNDSQLVVTRAIRSIDNKKKSAEGVGGGGLTPAATTTYHLVPSFAIVAEIFAASTEFNTEDDRRGQACLLCSQCIRLPVCRGS
jgi:hypothetical protein